MTRCGANRQNAGDDMIYPTDHFDEAAREATRNNRGRLQALESIVAERLPTLPRITLLCSPRRNAIAWEPSGQTFKSHGVGFISEHLLATAPPHVVEAVAVHEGVHTLIGREFRDTIEARHPVVYGLLHDRVIADWIDGRCLFEFDTRYIESKEWTLLYAGWSGPLGIDYAKAVNAVCDYFEALNLGCGRVHPVHGLSVYPPRAIRHLPNRWDGPLVAEYDKHPADVTVMVLTGFELILYYLEALTVVVAPGLCLIEEAFANFISSSLTGVSLEEIQRFAPQDLNKLQLAKRIAQSGATLEDVLRSTTTLRGTVEYARRLGILG
jgi:hypothetical protein